MALWFTGQKDNPHEHPGRTRAALILLACMVLLIHAGLGVVDIMGVPQTTMITAHLALTAVALLALRVALQLALLHEAHDPIERDEPLLCVHCEHVVPDMAFCPACGWRHGRRHAPPATIAVRRVPCANWTPRRGRDRDRPETDRAGRIHGARRELSRLRTRPALPGTRTQTTAVWAPARSVGRESSSGLGFWSVSDPGGGKTDPLHVPPDCGRPVTGIPVMALPRYTSPTGKFSVSYPTPDSAYEVTKDDNGVTAKFTAATPASCSCSPAAHGRTAKEIGKDLIKHKFRMPRPPTKYPTRQSATKPDTARSPIPAAGWQRELHPDSHCAAGRGQERPGVDRRAVGPYHAFGPGFRARACRRSQPQIAQDMGKYVNSFSWQGDPAPPNRSAPTEFMKAIVVDPEVRATSWITVTATSSTSSASSSQISRSGSRKIVMVSGSDPAYVVSRSVRATPRRHPADQDRRDRGRPPGMTTLSMADAKSGGMRSSASPTSSSNFSELT